ncbi:hypothetical protein J6590_006187 [Homalodisca vitripennis]|nr:hypothetical protein J6590_006187 [Homalodisca vitripennis]
MALAGLFHNLAVISAWTAPLHNNNKLQKLEEVEGADGAGWLLCARTQLDSSPAQQHQAEVIVYCRSRCALISGRDVHQYETRGRDNLRTHQRRLTLSQHLPQQVGVRLIKKLSKDIKNSNNLNQFKTRFRRLLVSRAFYSVDKFMTSRWDD